MRWETRAQSPAVIEEGLREAIDSENEDERLRLHYQPILDAAGELLGFEALLRFSHSELGVISPAEFIPVAEETRLILPVGRWVLGEVCRQIAEWDREGLSPVRVAVNISAVQWEREDFAQEVSRLTRARGVDPARLTMEVTESAVMQNASRAKSHMRELKAMGVRMALDDFGTGYSSLSHVHQMPLDVLKIDRSFTARLGQDDDSRTIVRSVISMAHLLGITTIAEGVESDGQKQMLVEMGCDAFQGYLYARPMPGTETGNWIRTLAETTAVSA